TGGGATKSVLQSSPPAAWTATSAELAASLPPGGLMLGADLLSEDETAAPTLARLGRALTEREERRHPSEADTWVGWWEAVKAEPALAGLAGRRERLGLDAEHHGSPSARLSVHVDALRKARFAEVGTLWQRGDNRLLCAVLG